MELVFLYINQSKNKFIQKQGFNFAGDYHFVVEYKMGLEGARYILKQLKSEHNLPENFFDSEGIISNITAIVGENGAGKTTLLNEILHMYGKVKDQRHGSEYDSYFLDKYEYDKFIAIYRWNSELICFHDIENLFNCTNIKVKNMHYLYQGSRELQQITANNREFENISKVCITNSMYADEASISTHQSVKSINLNPNALNSLKEIFYRRKIKRISNCVGGYSEIQDIVCSSKTIHDFQTLVDAFYFLHLKREQRNSIFDDMIFHTLDISFCSVLSYINKKYGDITDHEDEETKWLPCEITFRIMMDNYLSKLDWSLLQKDIFVTAYINLLYELIAYEKNDDSVGILSINDKEDLKKCIDNMIRRIPDSGKEIFANAFEEIAEYESILENCSNSESSLPKSDWAYNFHIQINRDDHTYDDFLSLIQKSAFEREYSFVLKYINIGGINLASGERALLNLFSWLHFLPYFNKINKNISKSLCDNVVILIDELDLYCHPRWQQKMIKCLIEEIKNQYMQKNIQIIFSTHSPIVLSDIPRSNVIYLQREKEHCKVDARNEHRQTFGANIYKLFDDAFFLGQRGQIGEFAKEKIQEIIDNVNDELENRENSDIYSIQLLEEKINLIGEELLQDKLREMLCKLPYDDNESFEQRKVTLYKKKIKQLEERMKNDSDKI